MRTILILAVIVGVGYLGISAAATIEMPTMREELAAKRAAARPTNPYDEAWDNFKANLFADKFTQYAESVAAVDEAIYKLAGDRDWSKATKCLAGTEVCRQKLAADFVAMGYEYRVPPLLLVAKARHETRLTAFDSQGRVIASPPDPRNGKRDRGIMQLRSPASDGCDMNTVRGQIACGAKYLRKKLNGQSDRVAPALTEYACGHFPAKQPRTINWVVPRNFILWQALERDYSAESLKQINKLGVDHQSSFQMSEWGPYLKLYAPNLEV